MWKTSTKDPKGGIMLDPRFWLASGERAIKTLAQTLVALIGTNAVGVMDLDWAQILGVAATATVLSILTSVASNGLGTNVGPSLTDETIEPDPFVG
jgi:hypothetical protein